MDYLKLKVDVILLERILKLAKERENITTKICDKLLGICFHNIFKFKFETL